MFAKTFPYQVVASLLCFASVASAEPVSVPGTGDGVEIFQELAKAFAQQTPAAAIEIPPSIGSGGGIAAVSDGRAVLGRIARPLTADESEAGLMAVPLMKIPSAIFVHRSAGVTGLSFAQLAGVYSGSVTDWSEVGGARLRIKVVRRDSEDSTLKVLRATMPGWKDLVLTARSKTAVTTQDAVRTVKDTEGAIGFGPLSATLDSGVTVVRIEGMDPAASDYPSAVTISLIYRAGGLPREAERFVSFARSDAARDAVRKLGAVPVAN